MVKSLRLAVLLALLAARGVPAVEAERVDLELWCDLDPIVQEGSAAGSLSREEALRRLLEEARTVLSGMIYGYSFVYTPSDESRKVAETFRLTARAEIPWGDERLSVAGTRLDSSRLYALFRYKLDPEQEAWRTAWQSGAASKASGTGTGNVFLGYHERTAALYDAVKEAIRGYLRPGVPNKPREVRGELLLWEVPGTTMSSGEYRTRVVIRLRIAALTPYRVY